MLNRLRQSATRFKQRREDAIDGLPTASGAGPSARSYSAETERRSATATQGAQSCIVIALLLFALCLFAEPCDATVTVAGTSSSPAADESDVHPSARCASIMNLRVRDPLAIGPGVQAALLISFTAFCAVHAKTLRSDPSYVVKAPSVPGRPLGVRDGEIDAATGERWCLYCEHWQPLRAKHCDQCGKCVRKFDHHCFWVGTCVGQGNHPRFYLLLVIDTLFVGLALFAQVEGLDVITQPQSWVMLAVGLACFAVTMLAMLFGLLAFHTYLVLAGTTTWEVISGQSITYLKGRSGESRFNRGPIENVRSFVNPPLDWSGDFRPAIVDHDLDDAAELNRLTDDRTALL